MANEQLAELVGDVRNSYVDFLFERLEESQYPSKQIMDRLEGCLVSDEHFQRYLAYLLGRLDDGTYPSTELMDRLERVLGYRG
jgi:hypothetical protein